jgi:hypothetical protein
LVGAEKWLLRGRERVKKTTEAAQTNRPPARMIMISFGSSYFGVGPR